MLVLDVGDHAASLFELLDEPRQAAIEAGLRELVLRAAMEELEDLRDRQARLEELADVRPDPETEEAPAPPPDSGPPGGVGASTSSPTAAADLPPTCSERRCTLRPGHPGAHHDLNGIPFEGSPEPRPRGLRGEELRVRLLADLRGGEGSVSSLAAGLPGTSSHSVQVALGELVEAGEIVWRPFKRGRRYRIAGAEPVDPTGPNGAEPRQDAPDSPDLSSAIAGAARVEPEPPPPPPLKQVRGYDETTVEYEILRHLLARADRIPNVAAHLDRKPAEVAHHMELLKRAGHVEKIPGGLYQRTASRGDEAAR